MSVIHRRVSLESFGGSEDQEESFTAESVRDEVIFELDVKKVLKDNSCSRKIKWG